LINSENDETSLEDKMDIGVLGVSADPLFQKIVNQHGISEHTRLQFIVASYFRTRTFHFMYVFSRNDLKMGAVFDRTFVQPLNMTSLLLLPWLLVNIIDSVLFRLFYTKYCPVCGWKFYKTEANGEHQHRECEYNREYKEVIQAILDGTIIRSEIHFKRLGLMKQKTGRRSAYWDMCARKELSSAVLDITCIWFSICLWILWVVVIVFPSISSGIRMLDM